MLAKAKKEERNNVHFNHNRFYLGYEIDISADGGYAAGISVSGRNMFVGNAFSPVLACKIIFEHIFDNFRHFLLTSTCSCTKI